MKKVLFYVIFTACSFLAIRANELENFDKGIDLSECLHNCRVHHRAELGMPHGSGQGMCWDVCLNEHLESSIDL